MWLQQEPNGSLTYSFVDAMNFSSPWMLARFIGGVSFVFGLVLMIYNLYRTLKQPLITTSSTEENDDHA